MMGTLAILLLMTSTPVTASSSAPAAEPTPPSQPPGPQASEDKDLGLIPPEIQDEPRSANATLPPVAPPRPRLQKKLFAEDAFTVASPPRTVPVPYPSTPPDWQNRTSFDLSIKWEPWRTLAVTLSDRLNLIEQDDATFLSRQTLRNDLREGYLTWEAATSTYLEAGRINLRNGVALGFNPTDFFKTRTSVGQASLDPSALRQNRLGTLMARAQKIWTGGSVSISYAPKIYEPSAIVRDDRLGLDPRFDATNAAHRVLGTIGMEFGDLSPQLLGYFESRRSKIGINLSRPFGDAVVAYVEWAGGRETDLATRSFAYGQATGTLPAEAPMVLPTDSQTAFHNDLAAGASWAIASKLTLNFEYHFHQAGFTRQDWRNWFDIGNSPTSPPMVENALWYMRGYANDQQEPMSRHQLFVRAAWPRAFTSQLELSGLVLVDLYEGSTLAQVFASYYLSDAWTFALYGSMSAGTARSERGSLPQFGNVALQIIRYM
jgi:opacity protein-like surface antigen